MEVEAEVLMAQRHREGWLPLPPLLCTSRRSLLAAWARKTLPAASIAHPAVLLTAVEETVCSEAMDSGYDAAGVTNQTRCHVAHMQTTSHACMSQSSVRAMQAFNEQM